MKRVLMAAALVAAGLLLPAQDAEAQYGSARGKVTDAQGQALQDAVVSFKYTAGSGGKGDIRETKTDKKGNYTQVGITIGNQIVTVSKPGYVTATAERRITSGEPMVIDFKLPAEPVKGPTGEQLRQELVDQFSKADALQKEGKNDEAEAIYKALLTRKEYEVVAPIWFRLGVLYSDKKDWANAETYLKKASELESKLVDAPLVLIEVYRNSGREAEADALSTKLLSEHATNGPLLFRTAVYYFNAGNAAKSAELFKKVTEVDPTLVDAWFHLGQLAMQQTNMDEAVVLMEKYLSLSPKNPTYIDSAQKIIVALKAAKKK